MFECKYNDKNTFCNLFGCKMSVLVTKGLVLLFWCAKT